MKNTTNSKTIIVTLAAMLVFGVIAIAPESANAYGYGGDYYGSGSYYGGTYIQGLAGSYSPWYPSIVVPIESQKFFIEQTWRSYGFSSSDFNYNNSGYDSHYSVSNYINIRGGYGY